MFNDLKNLRSAVFEVGIDNPSSPVISCSYHKREMDHMMQYLNLHSLSIFNRFRWKPMQISTQSSLQEESSRIRLYKGECIPNPPSS